VSANSGQAGGDAKATMLPMNLNLTQRLLLNEVPAEVLALMKAILDAYDQLDSSDPSKSKVPLDAVFFLRAKFVELRHKMEESEAVLRRAQELNEDIYQQIGLVKGGSNSSPTALQLIDRIGYHVTSLLRPASAETDSEPASAND